MVPISLEAARGRGRSLRCKSLCELWTNYHLGNLLITQKESAGSRSRGQHELILDSTE